MENQSALDARLRAAVRGLHANFGAGEPDVELSESISPRRCWARVLDQSAAHLSDKLERLGAPCASGLECAEGSACAHRRSGHGGSAEHIARQTAYGV